MPNQITGRALAVLSAGFFHGFRFVEAALTATSLSSIVRQTRS